MILHSQLGGARCAVLSSFYRREISLRGLGPIISITFDDFPLSAWTLGGSIVERFGGRATYYAAIGLMGTQNKLGQQFRIADLQSLVERGHELGSHSFSHLSAWKTPIKDFVRDVDHGERSIRESAGIKPSRNFAYPYGEVTLTAKRELGPRMGSSRGTCGGINGPDVDLNLLRANRLYGGIDQFELAKRLILENERRKGWLIFYSHDVASRPSQFGCTPELLEAVVSFGTDRGIKMTTVADAVREICRMP